jgi:hypothetical protein
MTSFSRVVALTTMVSLADVFIAVLQKGRLRENGTLPDPDIHVESARLNRTRTRFFFSTHRAYRWHE